MSLDVASEIKNQLNGRVDKSFEFDGRHCEVGVVETNCRTFLVRVHLRVTWKSPLSTLVMRQYGEVSPRDFYMKRGNTVELDGRGRLTLDDVLFEEIEPLLESDFAGDGVNIHLSLRVGTELQIIYLNQLSEGYESQNTFVGSGYHFELLEVIGYENPTVHLRGKFEPPSGRV